MDYKKFKDWLDDEIYNDRIDLSIIEQERILTKLRELELTKEA